MKISGHSCPPHHFVLTLWTDNPDTARNADRAGVDRIGLDLETIGKTQRQRGLDTWISSHAITSLPLIRATLSHAQLFVRCNSLHPDSAAEIGRLLDLGVQVIMLPNFQSAEELASFLGIVDGRAKVVPLIERISAARQIERILRLNGVDEIHIGLNDLSIDAGEPHRMALLTSRLLQDMSECARQAGVRLGIGGIARAYDGGLPVPSELAYAQYARLQSSGALIARSFRADSLGASDFEIEISRVRSRLAEWFAASPEALDGARVEFAKVVAGLAEYEEHAATDKYAR